MFINNRAGNKDIMTMLNISTSVFEEIVKSIWTELRKPTGETSLQKITYQYTIIPKGAKSRQCTMCEAGGQLLGWHLTYDKQSTWLIMPIRGRIIQKWPEHFQQPPPEEFQAELFRALWSVD